jgi:hypothetical protein
MLMCDVDVSQSLCLCFGATGITANGLALLDIGEHGNEEQRPPTGSPSETAGHNAHHVSDDVIHLYLSILRIWPDWTRMLMQ